MSPPRGSRTRVAPAASRTTGSSPARAEGQLRLGGKRVRAAQRPRSCLGGCMCPQGRTLATPHQPPLTFAPLTANARTRQPPALLSAARALPLRRPHRRRARAPRAALHRPRRPGLRAHRTCPRRSRARCSRATRATRARCGGCSSTSSPTRCPEATARLRRRRGQARGRALRAHLRRLRRRLGRPARRRARRVRVDLEHPHQDPPAPAPGRLPRAVHALHRLRRADARRRLPLLPRRARSGREYEAAMDALFGAYAEALPRRARVGRRDVPARRRRVRRGAPPRGQRQGATTSCAACCPPPRSRTWASTRPARPTSS